MEEINTVAASAAGGEKKRGSFTGKLGFVLAAAGSSYERAVKTTCFLSDIADFAAFNEVYGRYFTEKPARSCVAVKALPKGALVEVEVIAEA